MIVNAFAKISSDIKTLNEGWYPNWKDNTQIKYYVFCNLDDEFSCIVAYTNHTNTLVPSALCVKSYEIADYLTKNYKELYKDLYE